MIGAERSGFRPFMERSTAAMEKKDGGFTLIELLIALAVLSIMAGVLLQSFVVSRMMNTKARKDELLLDAAKRTMEELKGYPFEELEKFLAEGEGTAGGRIMIGNTPGRGRSRKGSRRRRRRRTGWRFRDRTKTGLSSYSRIRTQSVGGRESVLYHQRRS